MLTNPLLLIPGLGFTSRVWGPLIAQLSTQSSVAALDAPTIDYENQVGDALSAWCDAWFDQCKQPMHLLGWSLGGLLAMQYATRYPDRVLSVVTVATSPCFIEQDSWLGVGHAQWEYFNRIEVFSQVRRRLLALQGPKSACADLSPALISQPNSCWSLGLAALKAWDLREAWMNPVVPTLSVYGGRDQLLPANFGNTMAELEFKSTVVVLEDAPHALIHTDTGSLLELCGEFWRREY